MRAAKNPENGNVLPEGRPKKLGNLPSLSQAERAKQNGISLRTQKKLDILTAYPALFARRMKKAGIKGASALSLRHTHATHQLSRDTPLATVSERLGHKD